MLGQWLEEALVPLVRGDVQRPPLRQLLLALFVQNRRFHLDFLVLEVPPPNVEAVVQPPGIVSAPLLPRPLPHSPHDPRRGAEYFVNVPDVIPYESLRPQVGLPVLEEHEGVGVGQESRPLLHHEVYVVGLLQFSGIETYFLPFPENFCQAILHGTVNRRGLIHIVFDGGLRPALLLHDIVQSSLQIIRILGVRARRYGRDAFVGVPNRALPHLPQVRPQLHRLPAAAPVHTIPGGLLPPLELPLHGLPPQELLRGDDLESRVLLGDGIQVEEIRKRERVLLPLAPLPQEVHPLLGGEDQGPSHGVRENKDGLHGHPNVVPTPVIRLERHVPLRLILGGTKRGSVLRVGRYVRPVHHLGRGGIALRRSSVAGAGEAGDIVPVVGPRGGHGGGGDGADRRRTGGVSDSSGIGGGGGSGGSPLVRWFRIDGPTVVVGGSGLRRGILDGAEVRRTEEILGDAGDVGLVVGEVVVGDVPRAEDEGNGREQDEHLGSATAGFSLRLLRRVGWPRGPPSPCDGGGGGRRVGPRRRAGHS
mmetsp:Transcript_46536/g.140991  ORF Transcript_46536/g.140991 Transcript_46536/m.140991 type:complete len:533 (-) Transcript_46536:136-1734(-)